MIKTATKSALFQSLSCGGVNALQNIKEHRD